MSYDKWKTTDPDQDERDHGGGLRMVEKVTGRVLGFYEVDAVLAARTGRADEAERLRHLAVQLGNAPKRILRGIDVEPF